MSFNSSGDSTLTERLSFTVRIVVAMVCGLLAGWVFGSGIIFLGAIGKLYIQVIKVLAVPLVFFSIMEAVISTAISWREARFWSIVILCNTTCALVIGLTLSNIFRPGDGFAIGSISKAISGGAGDNGAVGLHSLPSFDKILESIVPVSLVQPFVDNNILCIVLLALLIGSGLRTYLQSDQAEFEVAVVAQVIRAIASTFSGSLLWLVRFVPFAVFCVTARTVGEFGFSPFVGLAKYVGYGVLGLVLQIVLVYPVWIAIIAGIPLRKFIKAAFEPVIFAFGTNSSLATLPLTLKALDTLGISKGAARLGACIGTNFNNDGIILYEAMAVLFVAQAFGMELNLGQQVYAALVSLIAAIGVAGVPEAGVASLSLVLATVGLPLEAVPLLLCVDWIVARMRSITNVLSDLTVSIAIDSVERQ